ncbi:hypothetical protein [Clostridium thermobutyricum]|uniref:hypothetical protein n=1 Tax=Clostridium thermobutyricum TaxID=29372 RepID=UPI002941F3EF|nr:hypothetical protein [Clostridium thermobutyricum]
MINTIVEFGINKIADNIGEVKIEKNKVCAEFIRSESDGLGGFELVEDKENCNTLVVDLELIIYNGKNISKNFNNIKLVFYCDSGKEKEYLIKNKSKKIVIAEKDVYENFSYINLKSKSIEELKLETRIDSDLEELKNSKMFLQYYDVENNKVNKEFLKDLH